MSDDLQRSADCAAAIVARYRGASDDTLRAAIANRIRDAHNNALEQAAVTIERSVFATPSLWVVKESLAAAIRALKEPSP